MEYSKNNEKPVYYRINKWSVTMIIGLFVIISGIIFIILSRFIYRGVIDDYFILIYILSDYFYLKAGFSFEKIFILLITVAYNNFQSAVSMFLFIGIILCAIGLGLTIFGFIQDYRNSR